MAYKSKVRPSSLNAAAEERSTWALCTDQQFWGMCISKMSCHVAPALWLEELESLTILITQNAHHFPPTALSNTPQMRKTVCIW